jgi:hypothetical protein
MSITVTAGLAFTSDRLSKDVAITAEGETDITVSVANGQTAFRVNLAIDVSQMKAIYIVSDKAVTIETNDSATPDETIVLQANVPLMWFAGPTVDTGGGASTMCPLPTDITDLYFANASGSTATVRIRVAQDATP